MVRAPSIVQVMAINLRHFNVAAVSKRRLNLVGASVRPIKSMGPKPRPPNVIVSSKPKRFKKEHKADDPFQLFVNRFGKLEIECANRPRRNSDRNPKMSSSKVHSLANKDNSLAEDSKCSNEAVANAAQIRTEEVGQIKSQLKSCEQLIMSDVRWGRRKQYKVVLFVA